MLLPCSIETFSHQKTIDHMRVGLSAGEDELGRRKTYAGILLAGELCDLAGVVSLVLRAWFGVSRRAREMVAEYAIFTWKDTEKTARGAAAANWRRAGAAAARRDSIVACGEERACVRSGERQRWRREQR